VNLTRLAALTVGLGYLLVQGKAMALSLDEALARAGQTPEVLSRQADEAAATALASAAGQLPDPRLTLSVDDFMLEGDQQYRLDGSKRMLGLMQAIPAAAKRDAERRQMAATRESSTRAREYAHLAAHREVSLLWLRLHYLARKETLLHAQAEENQRRQKVTLALLAGGGDANMALEPLLDRQTLDDAIDLLTRDRQILRARLAQWIGPLAPDETASGPLPAWIQDAPPPSPDDAAPPPGEDPDPETELRPSRARIAMAEAQWERARADAHPDWSVELGLGRDAMGQAMAMAKIGLSLPLFPADRQAPRIAAARARLLAAEAEHAMRKAAFTRQREELLAEEAALTARLRRLTQETLPLLARRTTLAEAAFSAGKSPATALIAAREKQLAAQLRALDLETERAAARARLHFLQQRSGAHHE
jgi:outer membrane protein TolC